MRLQNKICIVTGAGAGIGFATAGAFASEGAKVIALDRDQAGLVALNGEYKEIETHVLDVTDTDAVTGFFAALGKVDVLFNCAGMVAAGNLLNCTTSDWARTMELNAVRNNVCACSSTTEIKRCHMICELIWLRPVGMGRQLLGVKTV